MSEESGIKIQELRVDGGPTRNQYLMQFQSDILDRKVLVPDAEELSGDEQLMQPEEDWGCMGMKYYASETPGIRAEDV